MPVSPRARRRATGFSLVELLVALVVGVLVAGIGLRLLLRQHWSGMAHGDIAALQGSLRAGMLFLSTELRELGGTPGSADVLAFAPESLTYRAMRSTGLSCQRSANLVLLDSASLAGYRAIQAGRDSLLVHRENQAATPADDAWLGLPVISVGAAACGASPALAITTVLDTVSSRPAAFAPLAPVRSYEVMQVKLYQSAGDYWLGARSVSAGETIQPVIGPLSSAGLQLTYFDSAGSPAATAETIRRIGITLRAMSGSPVRPLGGGGPAVRRVDSLLTTVTLRNW